MQALARGRAAPASEDSRSLKDTPEGEPGDESAGDGKQSSGSQPKEDEPADSKLPDDQSTKQEET
jgi:hypothetical protein